MLRGSFQKRPNRKIIFAVLLPALCISFVLAACSFLFRIRSYKVTETYLFISADGAKSFLTVDLPVSYGYQEIGEIKVRNADEYYFEEMGGYQVLHASVTGESTGKTVEIEYTVTLHAGERTWDMETRDEYLQPSETSTPTMKASSKLSVPLSLKMTTTGRQRTFRLLSRKQSKLIQNRE